MFNFFKKVLPWIFVGLVLFFLGKTLWLNFDQVKAYQFHFDVLPLLGSFLFYGLGLAFLSLVFFILLKQMCFRVPFFVNLRYTWYSQLGSYIPGKLWVYVIKYKLLQKHEVTKTHFVALFVVEAIQIIAAGGVLTLFFASSFFAGQAAVVFLVSLLVIISFLKILGLLKIFIVTIEPNLL